MGPKVHQWCSSYKPSASGTTPGTKGVPPARPSGPVGQSTGSARGRDGTQWECRTGSEANPWLTPAADHGHRLFGDELGCMEGGNEVETMGSQNHKGVPLGQPPFHRFLQARCVKRGGGRNVCMKRSLHLTQQVFSATW